MALREHGKVFLNGVVVIVPVVFTLYVVVMSLLWFDRTMRTAVEYVFNREVFSGLGIVLGLAGIYVVGLLTRMWMFSWVIRLGEAIVERIPLVKSLYSAVKDILQFFGGTSEHTRGKAARVKLDEKGTELIGIITSETPTGYPQEDERKRVAVYLPMSYQLGGFTVYVPRGSVEEIEGMSVETALKLVMTAGVGRQEGAAGTGGAERET